MQILPRMSLGRMGFEAVRKVLDGYLQIIVEAANHNAKEVEFHRVIQGPNNLTYDIAIPHVGRNIVAINAVLDSGTCDIVVSDGTTDVTWKTAASATLSLSSTMVSDTAVAGRSIAAGSVLQVTVSNDASASRLALTIRTGS